MEGRVPVSNTDGETADMLTNGLLRLNLEVMRPDGRSWLASDLGESWNIIHGTWASSLCDKCVDFCGYRSRERLPSSKNLQTINAGEGVEKREPSCTVGRDVN